MAILQAYSARNASVRFNTTVVTAKRWTVTPRADAHDSTNFEGGGFQEETTGIRGVDVSIELDDNGALNYFTDSNVALSAGAITLTVKLYLNTTSGPFWSFPLLWIESVAMNADIRQAMAITITGKSHGPFAYPTTAIAGSTT